MMVLEVRIVVTSVGDIKGVTNGREGGAIVPGKALLNPACFQFLLSSDTSQFSNQVTGQ